MVTIKARKKSNLNVLAKKSRSVLEKQVKFREFGRAYFEIVKPIEQEMKASLVNDLWEELRIE